MELITGIVIGALVVWVRGILVRGQARQRARQWDTSDPGNQLRFLQDAELYPRKPINKEAFRTVFSVAERTLSSLPGKTRYRLLAEVAMGSFVGTSGGIGSQKAQDRAFASFNSKRVDFLVIDAFGEPRLVIEYQGSGHYQNDAVERDAVKRLALKQAGIPLLEIHEGATPAEVANKVRYWLGESRGG